MNVGEALAAAREGRDIDRAFEVLVAEYKQEVYGYLCKLCRDPDDAEELTQRTYIRAFRYIRRYDPSRAAFQTWLCRIAYGLFARQRELRRREDGMLVCLDGCEDVSVPGPDEETRERARNEYLCELLRLLPHRPMLATVMHVGLGRKHAVVARALGSSVRAAKQSSLDGMHMLRLLAEVKRMRKGA